jgi:hypothetical protein
MKLPDTDYVYYDQRREPYYDPRREPRRGDGGTMSDEAEQAFERWANSWEGRMPASSPEAREAFLAGFKAGAEAERDACPDPPFPED